MANFISRQKVLWTSILSIVIGLCIIWIMKAAILSAALSFKTGMNISIEGWSISWNSMAFKNFQIRTPSDRVYPTALRIGSIHIEAGLSHLLQKTPEIKSVVIDDVVMGINIYANGSSNWSKPLNRLEQSGGGSTSSGSSTKFIIDRFSLNNASVALTMPGKGEKKYGPTSIQVKNLGSSRAMTLTGLVEFIAKQITQEIIKKYAIPNLLQGIFQGTGKTILDPFKAIKKFFSWGNADAADSLPYPLD